MQIDLDVDYVTDKETIKQIFTLPFEKFENLDNTKIKELIVKHGNEIQKVLAKQTSYIILVGKEIEIGENK